MYKSLLILLSVWVALTFVFMVYFMVTHLEERRVSQESDTRIQQILTRAKELIQMHPTIDSCVEECPHVQAFIILLVPNPSDSKIESIDVVDPIRSEQE